MSRNFLSLNRYFPSNMITWISHCAVTNWSGSSHLPMHLSETPNIMDFLTSYWTWISNRLSNTAHLTIYLSCARPKTYASLLITLVVMKIYLNLISFGKFHLSFFLFLIYYVFLIKFVLFVFFFFSRFPSFPRAMRLNVLSSYMGSYSPENYKWPILKVGCIGTVQMLFKGPEERCRKNEREREAQPHSWPLRKP